MSRSLNLGGITFPLDAITQTFGILAVRGAGKSNTAAAMAEEMFDAGLPFVVVDPVGSWYGLRSGAEGKGPGLGIPIFGGEHGDVPLEKTGGALVADLVVDQRLSLGVLLVALAGCAVGPRSYDSTLPPVQHRAVRALVGATITLGADDVGIRPAVALAIGTLGQVAASKALMAVQHPDRLGPWTLGDVACDLTWSAAITPYLVGRHAARAGGARAAATAGGLTFAGWLAAAVLVARRCVP